MTHGIKPGGLLGGMAAALLFFAAGVVWEGRGQAETFSLYVSPAYTTAPVVSGLPLGALNINSAGAVELADLPGIGPVLARRIVEYRQENGPFAVPEDLLAVEGIGEETLAKIAPYIRFDLPWEDV